MLKEIPVKNRVTQELDDRITEMNNRMSLASWNSFVNELSVPQDIMPALASNRPELMKLIPARELSKAECQVLYHLIAGLIETNAALREHAQEVAHQVDIWAQAFKQLQTVGFRIQEFANFRRSDEDDIL